MALGNATLLVVDDDRDILTAARYLLERHYRQVLTCQVPDEIPALLHSGTPDLILLDMNFQPGASDGAQGLLWLERILKADPDAVVVMITAHGSLNVAVEAMKRGAVDYLAKPWDNQRLLATVSSALQLRASRNETSRLRESNRTLSQAGAQVIVGNSPALHEVMSLVGRAAPTDANVLILGENGTGKELVARELHRLSKRSSQVFVPVDMGALAESLFESELFGHRKGAFTDAKENRIGYIEAAHGGTLFLDEIGNLPLHLQVKLLAVLEKREVLPVGASTATAVDVRVIAATNMPHKQLSDPKLFRQDLLFRLNTVEILLPPLRKRTGDLPAIARHFIALYCQKYGKPPKTLSSEALDALTRYGWPGNIRELRHAIERAVILSGNDRLDIADFQFHQPAPNDTVESAGDDTDLNLDRLEYRAITQALKRNRYVISNAAKDLGLTRAALYRRMEKYGICSNFALALLLRLLVLSAGTAAYIVAFLQPGMRIFGVVLLLGVAALVWELWSFLQRTNREVTRFLASARHADFSQHFDFGELGCEFPGLGATFNDILARLKEQRLTQEVELRQLRVMVDHMPVPLLALGTDSQLQLLNNAARRFFGRNRVLHLDDLKNFGADFHAQVATCRAGEHRLSRINIDDNDSQVLIGVTALSNDSGTLQLVSLQDIGQELALAQLDAWQDLVRVLTHEIMNSITPVASLAQTTADMADELAAAAPAEHPHKAPLTKINDAAGTVARRAGNLMQFVANYRQLTGLPEPAKRRLVVNDLLAHVAQLAAASAAQSMATYVEVSPPGLEFHADPEQLEQVLINLLRNAEQALAGRPDGHIVLAAFLNARGRVTLEVRDNGSGIDEKILPRIFVPYFTTKPEGSGIGLALARQIVMAHGGTIRASNAEAGGAIFTLTF